LTNKRLYESIHTGLIIPRDWITEAIDEGNLREWHIVYEAVTSEGVRIEPLFEASDANGFLLKYFIKCIEAADKTDFLSRADVDDPHSPYQAASELVGLIKFAFQSNEGETLKSEAVSAITNLYDHASENVRKCIVAGVLEHLFQWPELCELFVGWRDHPERCQALEYALECARRYKGFIRSKNVSSNCLER
jgi:hypothetical protein